MHSGNETLVFTPCTVTFAKTTMFCKLVDEGKVKEAKQVLRGGGETVEEDRNKNWEKILAYRTAGSQFSSSSLYWETVETCYGSTTLSLESTRLPTCVATKHCPVYGLDKQGGAVVNRLVTVLAYNNPAVTFAPLLYPITSVLIKQGISEEDTYSYITMIVAPPSDQKISYFTLSAGGWDVLCYSLKSLARKYVVGVHASDVDCKH